MAREEVDPIYGYVDGKIEELKQDLLFNEIYPLRDEIRRVANHLVMTYVVYFSDRLLQRTSKFSYAKRQRMERAIHSRASHLQGRLDEGADPYDVLVDWTDRLRKNLSGELSEKELDRYIPNVNSFRFLARE